MIEMLSEAVKKGAIVRLLCRLKSDVLAADYAGRASFTELLPAGADFTKRTAAGHGHSMGRSRVFLTNAGALQVHQILIFSHRGGMTKGNVGILDKKFRAADDRCLDEDIKNSINIKLEQWIKRGPMKKIKERFFALFRRRFKYYDALIYDA